MRISLIVLLLFVISCGTGNKYQSSRTPARAKGTVKTSNSTPSTGTSSKKDKTSSSLLRRYADKMEVNVSTLKTPKLYEIIDSWIGTPYRNGGNTKSGVDCSGFIVQVYKEFYKGIIPRTTKELVKSINVKQKSKLKEGDLVFLSYDRTDSHVGIYLANGWFVHASSSVGVVLSDLKQTHYKQRYSKGGPLKIGSLEQLTK